MAANPEIETQGSQPDFTSVVRQTTEYTCGPAALATLVLLKGGDASETDTAALADTTEEAGTTLKGLRAAAKALGYSAKAYAVPLEDLQSLELPVLITDSNGAGGSAHYSVLKSISDAEVSLADSLAGNVSMSQEDFENIYTGKVLTIAPKDDLERGMSVDAAINVLEANPELQTNLVDTSGNPVTLDQLKELTDDEAGQVNGKYLPVVIISLEAIDWGWILLAGSVTIIIPGVLSFSNSISEWLYRTFDFIHTEIDDLAELASTDFANPGNGDPGCRLMQLPKTKTSGIPNPFGQKGSQLHQDKIKGIAENLVDAGWTIDAGGGVKGERQMPIPDVVKNGVRRYSSIRQPDIIAVREGRKLFVNVGRFTKKCRPVARERRAISDLEKVKDAEVRFVPYNVE